MCIKKRVRSGEIKFPYPNPAAGASRNAETPGIIRPARAPCASRGLSGFLTKDLPAWSVYTIIKLGLYFFRTLVFTARAVQLSGRPTPDTPGSGTASRSPRTSDLGGSLSLVVMHMRTRALLLTTPLPLPTPACQARRASQVPAALAGRPLEERRPLIAARRPLHAPRPRAGAHPTASTP